MPELPEVETMRQGIAPIVGSRIEGMRSPRLKFRPITIKPPLAQFRRRVVGRRIVAVGRAGKRVLAELDCGDRIVIEPRMSGRVLLREPPDRAHLRVVFELSAGPGVTKGDSPEFCGVLPQESGQSPTPQLLFWDSRGLGAVRLLTPEQFAEELGPASLGPDALEISGTELRQRMSASRRAIKVALLDQKIVAGVGNLYASELLHRARVHPQLPCSRLRPADWQRLHAAMQAVLREALAHQGSTLADGMYRTVQGEAGQYQEQHQVYQCHGRVCQQCGKSKILRIVQAQRSTFFCPNCQRLRRETH